MRLTVPHMRRMSVAIGGFTAIILFSLAGVVGAQEEGEESQKEFEADKGADSLDISGFPEDTKAQYDLFATKCSKCHTLARGINTDMTNDQWMRYVKRMMNKPNSGISPDTGKDIYKFLKYYQGVKDEARGIVREEPASE